jgi:hypothetical protein
MCKKMNAYKRLYIYFSPCFSSKTAARILITLDMNIISQIVFIIYEFVSPFRPQTWNIFRITSDSPLLEQVSDLLQNPGSWRTRVSFRVSFFRQVLYRDWQALSTLHITPGRRNDQVIPRRTVRPGASAKHGCHSLYLDSLMWFPN